MYYRAVLEEGSDEGERTPHVEHAICAWIGRGESSYTDEQGKSQHTHARRFSQSLSVGESLTFDRYAAQSINDSPDLTGVAIIGRLGAICRHEIARQVIDVDGDNIIVLRTPKLQ